MNNLMVDIETMGKKPGCAIIGIAAVEFNIETGETDRAFCKSIDLKSCVKSGLTIDPDTVMWWLNQSAEAITSLISREPGHVSTVLYEFAQFIGENKYYMWANSPSFDLNILEAAFDKTFIIKPWHFLQERDVRTIISLKPEIKANHVFNGIQHDPLDDCYNQIKYLCETYKEITKNFRKNEEDFI